MTCLVPTTSALLVELERARLWQRRLHDPWAWIPFLCIMIELLI